jgi:hypothetical protein
MICTAKENRDLKLRFVFNLISPSETILLQADSQYELSDWLAIIQNAISAQLNIGREVSHVVAPERIEQQVTQQKTVAEATGLPFSQCKQITYILHIVHMMDVGLFILYIYMYICLFSV